MRKSFVIFNPAARGEKSQRLRSFLAARAGKDVTLAPTTCAGDGTRLAREGVAQGYELIVAAGGDGTLNEVVNGIGPSGVPLGVLPLGTVNVCARELRIPLQLERAWDLLRTGKPRTLDLPCAEAGGKRRYFVQLAGLGFDARVVRAASWELKKKLGPLSYVIAGLQALNQPHPPLEIVTTDGQRRQGVAAFIGNGRFYGGSFRLFPHARYDDGLLDVCLFPTTRYRDLLRYGYGVLRATHHRLTGVEYFQAAAFHCAGPVPFELDGEDAGDGPVSFTIVRGGLQLLCPC
jgi:YegS/Rv2252/BmrU family lipid kinase